MISEAVWSYLHRVEGGFVNDPDDPGGATKYGVTQKEYDRWAMVTRSVEELTTVEARAFYADRYWYPGYCHELPREIALAHFDACVNLGKPENGFKRSVRILQLAVNDTGLDTLVVDGIIGSRTLDAISTHPALHAIVNSYMWRRVEYYVRLRNRRVGKKFMGVWMWRLCILRKEM
jgi:lysozyme family protein